MKKRLYFIGSCCLLFLFFSFCNFSKTNHKLLYKYDEQKYNDVDKSIRWEHDKSYNNFTISHANVFQKCTVKPTPVDLLPHNSELTFIGEIRAILASVFSIDFEESIIKLIFSYMNLIHWSDMALVISYENNFQQKIYFCEKKGHLFFCRPNASLIPACFEHSNYVKKTKKSNLFYKRYCQHFNNTTNREKYLDIIQNIKFSHIPVVSDILIKYNFNKKNIIKSKVLIAEDCVDDNKTFSLHDLELKNLGTLTFAVVLNKSTLKKKFYPLLFYNYLNDNLIKNHYYNTNKPAIKNDYSQIDQYDKTKMVNEIENIFFNMSNIINNKVNKPPNDYHPITGNLGVVGKLHTLNFNPDNLRFFIKKNYKGDFIILHSLKPLKCVDQDDYQNTCIYKEINTNAKINDSNYLTTNDSDPNENINLCPCTCFCVIGYKNSNVKCNFCTCFSSCYKKNQCSCVIL